MAYLPELLVILLVISSMSIGCETSLPFPTLMEKSQNGGSPDGETNLDLWVYDGEPIQPFKLWKTVQIELKFKDDDPVYAIYQNFDQSEVFKAYEENQKFFNLLKKWSSVWKPSSYLAPFSKTYVGIETKSNYEIWLKHKSIDYILATLFITGILLFFGARRLSRSSIAYYAGGTTLGVVGSLLIVVFLLYRMSPKKSMAFSVLIGGWSLVTYVGYIVWKNLYSVLTDYYRYVAVYLVSAAFISFAFSYVRGPPKGDRTLNLIQWGLQVCGLALVYFGCQIPALSVATIIALIVINNVYGIIGRLFHRLRLRYFPPTRRLLTEDEYLVEGVRATNRSLNELRKYCRSPEFDWPRMISRINSPKDFAEFISGNRSHISDDEVLRYSNESMEDPSDNEEEDSDESSSIIGGHPSTSARQSRPRSRFYTSYNNGLPQSPPVVTSRVRNRTFNGTYPY